MRPWLGLQLMMVQGFAPDYKLQFNEDDTDITKEISQAILLRLGKQEVTDADLHQMAGNTMTIPVMMAIQVPCALPGSPGHCSCSNYVFAHMCLQ